MVRILIMLVFLFSFVSTTYAGDFIRASGFGERWSKTDYALEGIWEVLHIIDWGQTRDIENHPGVYETNFWMGHHPSHQTVDLYMGGWAVLHPVITHWIPKKITIADDYEIPLRSVFQGISIGATGGCVVKNFRLGLEFKF